VAGLLRDTGRAAEARKIYEKARDNLEELIKSRPGSASDQFELARVLIEINKPEPDLGGWDRIIATLRNGIALVEKMPARPLSLYERARGHALLSAVLARTVSHRTPTEAREEAELSIYLLRQAVESGYHDLVSIKTEDDLESLRSRGDFQTLLMDAAFSAEPFVR
jgi:hypothetical protein